MSRKSVRFLPSKVGAVAECGHGIGVKGYVKGEDEDDMVRDDGE
jgi:hypothetical protein